jgi:3-dehydroquinate synthase
MEQMVRRCAILHLDHIRQGGDPFEFGSARPLDFGHWSAHKLESLTRNELRHGEAVAIGLALDLFCAARLGFISAEERDRVCRAMENCGLPLWHAALARRSAVSGQLLILAGLEEFRQHLGGALTLAMPDGLGRKRDLHQLPTPLVEEAVRWLQARVPVSRG